MHWLHKFEPIAVQHSTQQTPADVLAGKNADDLKEGLGIQKTNILKRCACGALRTEYIRGWWTLAQIKGES